MQKRPLGVRLDTSLESLLARAPVAGTPVLATLVATDGSTYRKAGARMLIMADGSHAGLLSGGCLEADLALHAREVLDRGVARAVEYDLRGADDLLFGIGAGCEGAMRVLLEPAGPDSRAAAAMAEAGRLTRAGSAASLVAVHDSGEIPLGTYPAAALEWRLLREAARTALATTASQHIDSSAHGRRTRAFVQYLAPPPHVLICGAGPDAQPVVAAAVALGWRVSVVDHRPAYALTCRFPKAEVHLVLPGHLRSRVALDTCHAAVVMSHLLIADVGYLREFADSSGPAYVGLLGPAARRRRIALELGAVARGLDSRLHGPVGLDIGAATPEGIALAIVGQVHAWLAGRVVDAPSIREA